MLRITYKHKVLGTKTLQGDIISICEELKGWVMDGQGSETRHNGQHQTGQG